jgi:hypothetical protein
MTAAAFKSHVNIEAWDEGTSRQDLAVRKEMKFTFDRGDVGAIRQVLQQRCKRIIHQEPVSWVRSIYFDDEVLSACRANLNGLGLRTKVRLRWYDSLLPHRKAFWEIKWRRNRTTGKHRLHLTSPVDLSELDYRSLGQSIRASLPQCYAPAFDKYRRPVSIVQYCREHFVTPDRQIRITMDYGLTFYDQLCKSRVNTRFPVSMGDFVVVEGKTAVGSEQQLRRLLSPLARRASRCSKYVHSCRLLGHVTDAE